MSEEGATAPTTAPQPTGAGTTGGVTTREQAKKNSEDKDPTAEDGDTPNGEGGNKKKEREKEAFKGWTPEMKGNVFQLAEEGRKGNQYTTTLDALKNYTNIKFDHAIDLAPLFETPCEEALLFEPDDEPPFLADKVTRATRDHRAYIEWKFQCEQYNAKTTVLESNLLRLFTTILLQCSQSVKTKLEAATGYETAKSESDCQWLLVNLKNICHRFEHTENRFVALVNAKAAIFNFRQSQGQSTTDYYETFKELVSVLESFGGKLHDPEEAAPESAKIAKLTPAKARDDYMRGRYCAVLFLRNAENGRYEALKNELANAFAMGRDEYPATLTDAHQLLLSYKGGPKRPPNSSAPRAPTPKTESGRGDGTGKGYRGNRGGRVAKSFVQTGFCLTQIENHFPDGIPDHFILLDSDSTVSIFRNPSLLTNIRTVTDPLYLETNGGGHQISTQMGTIKDFGDVWYNPNSIANVLSLAEVRRVRRVTMDTAEHPAFYVHRTNGEGATVFPEHESGLYLLDASVSATNVTNTGVIGYSCLQTVAENKALYTKRQVSAADDARKLYRLIGRPSHDRFLHILRDNLILNCPVTTDDATRAMHIYGKDIAFLKGKSTAAPAAPHTPDCPQIPLPPDILVTHGNITLSIDIFYVLGLPFYLSSSRNIHFLSCRPLTDRNKASLRACLAADLSLYQSRGLQVTSVHADSEFAILKSCFSTLPFSICAVDSHVPAIERAIRSVKDTIRSTIHGMPFKRIPRNLLKDLVTQAIWSLNALPHPDGVSATLSPATIVRGDPKPDFNALKLEFGTYTQVYDGTSNDTKSRTLGAIATNATGNSCGDYYFISLTSGQRIHRRSWTVIPISDSTISRVEAIAHEELMPLVDSDLMINEYDPSELIDESAYDRPYLPPIQSPPDADHILTSDAYSDDDDDVSLPSDDGHHPDFDDVPVVPPVTSPSPMASPVSVERISSEPEPSPTCSTQNEERNTECSTQNEERNTECSTQNEERNNNTNCSTQNGERDNINCSTQNEERKPSARKRTGLRPGHSPDFSHRFGFTQIGRIQNSIQQADAPTHGIQRAITGLMFTQMTAQKGIKKHGQVALDALKKEFLQFRKMDVLEPLDAFQMTDEQKQESLRALSVIKEKRDGSLKGRTCADGSSQQGKFTKEQTGSPTISNDALFMTVMIDAFENRDVATADVTGAYLHAHMKEFISMRFTGWAVDLLCEVNPEYSKYTVVEGKTKVLYVRCNKAIYGCVVSGVLWYELFSQTLEGMGFSVNPYDFCVANATLEGTQCTIGWFVDDTKISHKNPLVVTKIVDALESKFGKMTVTRGKEHEFLGMTIKYLGDGSASIHMPSYITSAIKDSGLTVTKHAPSPCANSLLTVDEKSPLLSEGKAKIFHSVVAKLIYVGTRARTDILLVLAFLCSRVSAPTEQDEKKLQRLLEYLLGTIDLELRLGADSLNQFATWVDASFAVHDDMRSHTGGVISFGRGGLICKSKKQNINTKSSTEAELIGASDYLPNTLYVKMFMEAQGYPINKAIFHQDNESAIKMESNGKSSCGQRSRHIDIRYFFITDHSRRQSIKIQHCPTADMLADFFTKPLQGAMFRRFRDVLLGIAHIDTLCLKASLQQAAERVGNNNNLSGIEDPGAESYPLTVDESSTVNTSHSIEKYPEE